ncbi:pancreatic lipase-related protein 2 [Folsomia candida]|uniref:Pancreatic lipase-related protein 2 n=1 Tax=Folsomia candida TaxID=158441 RepID=A0A226DHT1_FOLCA|nr:pancreatic lipase-related protein 2 [Folsomia candida]OXA44690.1 Pancreatic lipase-related protein 2 [Folsomia candida]
MLFHFAIIFSFVTNLPLCTNVLLPFEIGFNPDEIKFYLVKSTSFKQEIKYTDELSLRASSLQPGGLTIVYLHGFLTSEEILFQKPLISSVTDSLVVDNFIIVDWRTLAGKPGFPLDIPIQYVLAINNIKTAGKRVANFIAWLTYNNYLNLDRVHIIGHSIGAHLSGRVGTEIQLIMGGRKITRITGLDPAGPLFYPKHQDLNIDKNDAYFVDVYHTNAGFFGDDTLDGHVDFSLNRGDLQPGCNLITEITVSCSHVFSVDWFFTTFRKGYIGCQCSSRELDAINFQTCLAQCPNPVFAGIYIPHTTRGTYHVDVPKLGS